MTKQGRSKHTEELLENSTCQTSPASSSLSVTAAIDGSFNESCAQSLLVRGPFLTDKKPRPRGPTYTSSNTPKPAFLPIPYPNPHNFIISCNIAYCLCCLVISCPRLWIVSNCSQRYWRFCRQQPFMKRNGMRIQWCIRVNVVRSHGVGKKR